MGRFQRDPEDPMGVVGPQEVVVYCTTAIRAIFRLTALVGGGEVGTIVGTVPTRALVNSLTSRYSVAPKCTIVALHRIVFLAARCA